MTSLYFEELFERYSAEIEDLRSDSSGQDILTQRLREKRQAFSALLPMIPDAPEMVACALHGAFRFQDAAELDQASQSEPGELEFPAWPVVAQSLNIAPWATPLIDNCLREDDGDNFLVTTAVLEWLLSRDFSVRRAPPPIVEADDEMDDLGERGSDWLTEQGFDDLNH